MSEFYGNQISGKWRGYIDSVRVINDYPDHAVIRAICGFQATGWGFQIHGLRGVISINNNAKDEGGKNVSLPSGSWGKVGFVQHDVSVPKGTSGMNIRVAADVINESGYYNGVSHVEGSCWINAKDSHTVSYNANGGTGAPGAQTKWWGSILTLSSTLPTRTGYTFQGWSTSTDSSVEYQPGSQYGADVDVTLYAVWQANTWTVSYNSNGGSGSPGNQTKVYGQTLTLSSTRPTRNLYNFMGWGTSSGSTTPSYQPGGAYTNNASITLYAIWELAWVAPRITNLQATRCTSDGTLNDEGTYAKVSFNWATDRTVSSIRIVCNGETINGSGSGTSGSVSLVLGKNLLSTENSYTVTVTVTDSVGSSSMPATVAPMNYIMDFAPNGSVAIGKPANQSTREFEIATEMVQHGAISGFIDYGQCNGNIYRVLARSARTYDDLGSAGKVRIVGQIGHFTTPGSIDITVQFRDGNVTNPIINSMSASALNATVTSLQVIVGDDKYVYIVIWHSSSTDNYYFYDLQLYGKEVRIVNSDWSSSRPAGTVMFDSNVISYGTVDYPAEYVHRNNYWGFALPNGAENEWIRTTKDGLIPYAAGGNSSSLGTVDWPFNNVWTNKLNWTGNGLGGRVQKTLWSGTVSIGATITVPEAEHYNLFSIGLSGWTSTIFGIRSLGSRHVRFFGGYDNGVSHENYYASFNLDKTGTKWTYIGGNRHNFTTGVVALSNVGKIYGLL